MVQPRDMHGSTEEISVENIPELICSDIKVKLEQIVTPETIDATCKDEPHHNFVFDNRVKTENPNAVDTSRVFEVYEEVKYAPTFKSSHDFSNDMPTNENCI